MMASGVATSAGFANGVPGAVWAHAANDTDISAAVSPKVPSRSCVRLIVASLGSSQPRKELAAFSLLFANRAVHIKRKRLDPHRGLPWRRQRSLWQVLSRAG